MVAIGSHTYLSSFPTMDKQEAAQYFLDTYVERSMPALRAKDKHTEHPERWFPKLPDEYFLGYSQTWNDYITFLFPYRGLYMLVTSDMGSCLGCQEFFASRVETERKKQPLGPTRYARAVHEAIRKMIIDEGIWFETKEAAIGYAEPKRGDDDDVDDADDAEKE